MDENIDRAHIAWPIVDRKDLQAPSVFRPETLLREARRQRRLPLVALPKICILDPDGDVVRHVKRTGAGPHVEEIIGAHASIALHRGATWTTDAPYRETASAIERARQLGALAVARSVENANHQRALQGWVATLLPPASSRLLTKSDGFQ